MISKYVTCNNVIIVIYLQFNNCFVLFKPFKQNFTCTWMNFNKLNYKCMACMKIIWNFVLKANSVGVRNINQELSICPSPNER